MFLFEVGWLFANTCLSVCFSKEGNQTEKRIMASLLNEDAFVHRMEKLSASQESIESTSSWVSLWRREATTVVAWWESYYRTAPTKKKLSLLYLANDVVQTSRQKGPEFVNGFLRVLPKAVALFNMEADAAGKKSVDKLVTVWQTRQVFGRSTAKFQSLVEEASKQVRQQGGKSAKARRAEPTDAAPVKRQKALPRGIDTLVALMERAEDTYKKRMVKEVAYDQSGGSNEEALHGYKSALRDEMSKRNAVVESLEALLQEEQSKYNKALGSLSVLPVYPAGMEETRQEDVDTKNNEQEDDTSKIAEQVMNDPAALLELLGSLPKKSVQESYDPVIN